MVIFFWGGPLTDDRGENVKRNSTYGDLFLGGSPNWWPWGGAELLIDKLPPLVIFEPKEFIVRTFRTETVPKTAD